MIEKFARFYVIEGPPIPLRRARHGGRSVYDSQKLIKHNCSIVLEYQHVGDQLEGPLFLEVIFYLPIAKSNSQKHLQNRWHATIPDLTNLLKFIEDVADEAGLFRDDAQIAKILAEKRYGDKPRTEFILRELSNE